jgi:predicted RNA-binding protein with PUA domain
MMKSGIKGMWVLPAFIVLGVAALFFADNKLGSPSSVKAELQTSRNSEILVVPIQIERDKYGVAMVDTTGETLWIYELNSTGPAHNRLRLLAARSWRYDRLLKQYNTAEPKPEQVRMLLEEEVSDKQVKEQVEKKQEVLDVNISEANEPNE